MLPNDKNDKKFVQLCPTASATGQYTCCYIKKAKTTS